MPTTTDICNLAIAHLGQGKRIADLDTERSAEANAFRMFYTTTLDEVLRDYPWPFATKILALGLVEEEPNSLWGYSYSYPADCVFFRKIVSGQVLDTEDTKVPFQIGGSDSEQLIFTNQHSAEGEYTRRVLNAGLYSPDFVMSLSFKLAAYVAPTILGGNSANAVKEVEAKYYRKIATTKSIATNEEKPGPQPESEFIRARNS